jgi:hypothetical protein
MVGVAQPERRQPLVTIPIDDEAYREHSEASPEEVEQGNPGRPQSDFDVDDDENSGADGGIDQRMLGRGE